MHRPAFLAVLFATTAGCSNKSDIWLIEVDTTKGDGYSCATEYSTNFSGTLAAGTGGTDGPVTETRESIGSKILFYAKLVDLAGGQASFNSGDLLLPGEEQDGDKWRFAWTEAESDIRTVSHEEGYVLEQAYSNTYTTQLVLTFDGKTASGSMTVASGESTEAREDDLWSEDAANELGGYGSLGWSTTDGYESNTYDTSDCDGDDCTASSATSCGATAPVTAVRTDLTKQEDFASLVSLQQYGSFKTSSSSSWGGGWDSGW